MNAKRAEKLKKVIAWALIILLVAVVIWIVAEALINSVRKLDELEARAQASATEGQFGEADGNGAGKARSTALEPTPMPSPELPVALIPTPIETEDVEPMQLSTDAAETPAPTVTPWSTLPRLHKYDEDEIRENNRVYYYTPETVVTELEVEDGTDAEIYVPVLDCYLVGYSQNVYAFGRYNFQRGDWSCCVCAEEGKAYEIYFDIGGYGVYNRYAKDSTESWAHFIDYGTYGLGLTEEQFSLIKKALGGEATIEDSFYKNYMSEDGVINLSEYLTTKRRYKLRQAADNPVYQQSYDGSECLEFVVRSDGKTIDHVERYAQFPSATAAAPYYLDWQPTYSRSVVSSTYPRAYRVLLEDVGTFYISDVDLVAIFQMQFSTATGSNSVIALMTRAFEDVPTDFSRVVEPGGNTVVDWRYLYTEYKPLFE